MTGGSNGSATTSGTGSGTGAGLGAGAFFFLGFLFIIVAHAAQPHTVKQQINAKRSHCHVRKYEPEEPEPVEPELALEPEESPEEPHLKELE